MDDEIARLSKLADLLDSQFRIPGTKIRFGVDSLLGLFPLVGDGASALPAIYLIHRARRLGVPKSTLNLMIANLIVDLSIGAIPLLGDFFDIAFKANRRNIALLRNYLEGVREVGEQALTRNEDAATRVLCRWHRSR